jgi:hypothetical protein
MESVDATIARANEHLHTLTRELQKWVDGQKRDFFAKHNPNTGEQWVGYWVDDEHPPTS